MSERPPPRDLSPQDAWSPLPAHQFDLAAARHLLRRTGFSAQPEAATAAVRDGLETTLRRMFSPPWPAFPEPARCAEVLDETAEGDRLVREAPDNEAREKVRREIRERTQAGFRDLAVEWLRRAARPEHSAREKFLLFLFDILVISREKIQNPRRIHAYWELLRAGANGNYPDLLKAVSRSPAMVRYLDLDRSNRTRPNENFARELFELFSLGEGNYTEDDVKEAARAFTGYRQRRGEFYLDRRQMDTGPKTIFGRTGAFDGDAVIDLIFTQPAARNFLPTELCRFYLSTDPIPQPYIRALGDFHRSTAHSLPRLVQRFFSSRMFFHPDYRSGLIKSPFTSTSGSRRTLASMCRPSDARCRRSGSWASGCSNLRTCAAGWAGASG
jgi:uncharacterized protein (DUF1800 family)